jgi:hypothetical protein
VEATQESSTLVVFSANGDRRVLLDRAIPDFLALPSGDIVAAREADVGVEVWWLNAAGDARLVGAVEATTAETGPFGLAVSPDGRSIAAGWAGDSVRVFGPAPAELREIGSPVIVSDDGEVLIARGVAGDVLFWDNDTLSTLGFASSDPLARPGSTLVAWHAASSEPGIGSVELFDPVNDTRQSLSVPTRRGMFVSEVGVRYVLLEQPQADANRVVLLLDVDSKQFLEFRAAPPG